MTVTAELQIQTLDCLGRWGTPESLADFTCWGHPVVLSDEQLLHLRSGREVRYGDDWYNKIRLTRPALIVPTPAARAAFTCRICGDHRDTTLRGHCDDCEG